MRWKIAALALALLLILAPSVGASDNPVGTASLLDIGLSARALAMGGAGIAVADDANAIYYNPAGLGVLDTHNIAALYTQQFGAANYMALGYAGPHIGANIFRLDASGIQETDPFANETGVFGVTELAGAVGYGRTIWNGLNLGASAKFYMQNLPENAGRGFTLDAGALLNLLDGKLSFGLVGRNLLGKVRYTSGSEDEFDRTFGIGVAARPIEGLLIAADACMGNGVAGKFGAEYRYRFAALRAGMQLSSESTCYTAGVGFFMPGFSIDYAYQAHSVLPDSHRISLGAKF